MLVGQLVSVSAVSKSTNSGDLTSRNSQPEPEMQELKKHQTCAVAGEKVMKFKVLLIPAMLAQQRPPGAAGESRPAAEACQQAVMEAECESVTHSAHTSE